MDFFQHQDQAHRRTLLLAVLLLLAVVAIAASVFTAVSLALGFVSPEVFLPRAFDLRHPGFFWVTGGTFLLIVLATVIKAATLGDGGARLVQGMGAREIGMRSGEREAVLRNVVEEMAIASGVPAPRVYVLPDEPSINGFVCGTRPANATLVVTRGALDQLRRDELQALVAHEFSHLCNGDTRLNLRLIAVLHGILLLAVCGRGLISGLRHVRIRSSRDSNSAGGILLAILVTGAALWLIGAAGEFFARLIKLAINRQREFLADASAVQFTRHPDALVSLLNKLRTDPQGGVVRNPRATEFSHFFFADALRRWGGWLTTHPPLEERIRRLLPAGAPLPKPAAGLGQTPGALPARVQRAEGALADLAMPLSAAAVAEAPEKVAEAVGAPQREHLRRTRDLLSGLDPAVREATQDPLSAQAVVAWVLLSSEADPEEGLRWLLARVGDDLVLELRRLHRALAEMAPEIRLPLLDLSLPALRALTPDQHRVFRAWVDGLMDRDGERTLVELAVHQALRRHLGDRPGQPRRLHLRHTRLDPGLAREWLAYLVAAERDPAAARRAALAVLHLPEEAGNPASPPRPFAFLLTQLARTAFSERRKLLIAAATAVAHDGHITPDEAEFVRAVADALDCPIPPWLAPAAAE
jgi:Zn-dependent protease with chaperone function